jgi:hypothetical protein
MRAPFKLLIVLCLAQIILISALLLHARSIQNETPSPLPESSATSSEVKRLALIETENDRLKKGLAEIATLRAEAQRLENQFSNETAQIDRLWNAQSNHIHSAIEQTRRRITEIEEWERHRARQELQDRAASRLAQRGPIDYPQLEANLRAIGDRASKLLAIRREWAGMDKDAKKAEAFKARMSESWMEFDKAQKQLGDDLALFQDFAAGPTVDPAATILLHSILPDQHGRMVTVYYDGNVVWSPPLN